MRKNIKNKKGYSLLEIIVSISMFSVIFLMISTIYLYMLEAQRSTIATQTIQESMKFIFEVISKETRTAVKSDLACTASLPAGYSPDTGNKVYNIAENTSGTRALFFENKNGECVTYYLENDGTDNRFKIKRDGLELYVTPRNLNLSNLHFRIIDDLIDDFHSLQPSTTIRVDTEYTGSRSAHNQKTSLQTTISSRYYE